MDNPAAVPPGRIRLLPYFRIIWGGKEVIRGNWYLGLIGLHTKGYPRELWVYLSMRGFLRWSAGTLVVTYFVGAAALAWFYSRNPFNKITYADLILPTRWSELRTLRGEANIEEGLAKLKAKQYGAAFMLLNQGLARKPDNIPARLMVAQFFTSAGYYSRAIKVYRAGIPYAADQRRFMENAFQLAEYMEDYDTVLQFVADAEAVIPPDELANRRFLADKRILANEKLGKYEANLRLWESAQPTPTMRLNTAWARALSATNRGDEAIAAICREPRKFGILKEPWELLLELARANGRTDAGRIAVNSLVALEPTGYRFLAVRIAYLSEIADVAEAANEVDNYFLRFGYDEKAVVALLKAVEGKADLQILNKIWSGTRSAGQATPAAYVSYIRSLTRMGQITLARQELLQAEKVMAKNHYPESDWATGSHLLLNAMEADTPSNRNLLESFTAQRPLPPEAYRSMTRDLLATNQNAIAYAIAAQARDRYPAMQNLPVVTLETNAAEPKANPPHKAKLQIVPATEAQQALAALDNAILAQDWNQALEDISKVENSPLARELSDQLLFQRITIHGYRSDQSELAWYMRRLLSTRMEFAQLRNLAVQLHTAGHKDSSQTILKEILRKHPEAKWAAEQMRAWENDPLSK